MSPVAFANANFTFRGLRGQPSSLQSYADFGKSLGTSAGGIWETETGNTHSSKASPFDIGQVYLHFDPSEAISHDLMRYNLRTSDAFNQA
eukprot:4930241-Pleurochrysis_carterae.AAC.9